MIKFVLISLFLFFGILLHAVGQQSPHHGVFRIMEQGSANNWNITLNVGLGQPDGSTIIREFVSPGCEFDSVWAPGAITQINQRELKLVWLAENQLPQYVHYRVKCPKDAPSIFGDYAQQSKGKLHQELSKTISTSQSNYFEWTRPKWFSGVLKSSDNNDLSGTLVKNINGPYESSADKSGHFTITACPGDTLHFSHSGFHDGQYVVLGNESAGVVCNQLISKKTMQAIPVEVRLNANGEYRFYRNGIEYYVKGGGGSEQWDELASIGGNSVRTWSTDNAKEVLDYAHSLGLTVMMGLWMQHERHGFDYDDKPKVQAQLEYFRKIVMEIKDHPALLFWGIGNEVDLFYTNTNVWKAVNDVAKMIHEVDPNHPTSTVTAGLDPAEVKLIMQDAPEIDIYCINTYGDIASVKKNLANYGWAGPYLITEWGPNGHWEVTKTRWGAPIEQTSAEKAASYKERYEQEILAASKNCMGSYAFLWGFKQETTSTWYGLFTREGLRSEPIDELEKFWSGKDPDNQAPHLISLTIDDKKAKQSIMLTAEKKYQAASAVADPEGDKLKSRWLIVPESTDIKAGGDAETAPTPISGLFQSKGIQNATFRAPKTEGAYRLFYEVTDGSGHCAYGNIPFYVVPPAAGEGPARMVRFKQQDMQ